MSTLKDLLGDKYTPEIEAAIGSKVVYIWNKEDEKEKDKEPIPKHRVNEMIETLKAKNTDLENQVKTFETTLETKEKDLKDLKKKAEGNDDLTKQIDELQKNFKAEKEARETDKQTSAQKEMLLKKTLSLKEKLLNAGVSDAEAREVLARRFDVEKLESDENGSIKDDAFNSQLSPIKDNAAFASMFGTEVIAGQEHKDGGQQETGFYTREQVTKMTQDQVNQNIEKINKSMETWK